MAAVEDEDDRDEGECSKEERRDTCDGSVDALCLGIASNATARGETDRTSRCSVEPSTPDKHLNKALVWIDLEMTGLDVEKHKILEIACLVSDGQLKQVIEGPALVIHQPESVLADMNDWCVENHGKSGLTQRVRESKISLEQAEDEVLGFIQRHVPPKQAPLTGNSVHADLAFLKRYMPRIADYLHYRIVDVSTVQELAMRWNAKSARKAPKKVMRHTALSDIYESLEQLRFYKATIFNAKGIIPSF